MRGSLLECLSLKERRSIAGKPKQKVEIGVGEEGSKMAYISEQYCNKCKKIASHLDGRCWCERQPQQSGGIVMPDRMLMPVNTESLREELKRVRAAAFWCFNRLTDRNNELALESWPDINSWGGK